MSIYPPPIRSAFSSATKTRVRVVAAVASVVGLVALLAVVTGFPMKQFKSPSVGPSFTATPTATRTPLVTVETHLTAISMVSPTEGWAVGYDGAGKRTRLLHFHSGSWTLAADPSVTILPRAVTMLSATDGWIGGAASDDGDNAAGVMLHYSDDEWTPFPLPPGAGAINSISMVSANEGWAVDDTPDSGHAHILHYTGGVWTIAKTMADHSLLQSVSMVNATDGWIAGRGSYNPGLNDTPGALWHFHYGAWQRVTPSDPHHADVEYVSMLPSGEGWGIGSYAVPQTTPGQDYVPQAGAIWHYSGGRWHLTQRLIDKTGVSNALALYAYAANDVWVSASDFTGNHILRGDGATWASVPTGAVAAMAIAMDSSDDGWAVGDGAQLLHYYHKGWMPFTP